MYAHKIEVRKIKLTQKMAYSLSKKRCPECEGENLVSDPDVCDTVCGDCGLVIDINLTGVADNPGFSHYAIQVDNINKTAKELKEKGYNMDGPVENKDTKRKIITVRDPNGFLIQFVEN